MSDMFNIISRVKAVKTFKGIDNRGFESIVFIFKKKPKFELKTSKIVSRILERPDEYRLFISLVDDNKTSGEIFDVLTEDLLRSIENVADEQKVLEILASRFQYWSDLFKRKREQMDEKWIRGFIGELWFLSNILAKKIGINNAIRSWTGSEKGNQDFITEDKIFEIKTCIQQAISIKISNYNQLSKNMFLAVMHVSRSSDVSSSSVNLAKLISCIDKMISSPETHIVFNEKLLELGLFPIDESRVYDRFSYDIQSLSYFEIDENFPIIDHATVPDAVLKYSYDLSLSAINEFAISEDEIWS